VSVWAELCDAVTGHVVTARSLRAALADLTAPGAAAVAELAAQLCDAVVQHQLARVRHLPLPSLEAYALALAGVTLMHRFSVDDFARAEGCLDALAERVPRHAMPYAWLARWHVFRVVQGWSPDPDRDRARARDLSQRALDIDPDSSLALTVAGSVKVSLFRDLDGAARLYDDALRRNPSEALAWLLLGTVHTFKGDGEAAMRHADEASRLSPLDPMRFYFDSHAAAAAVTAQQYDKAVALAERSIKANRMYQTTWRSLAIAQAMAGRVGEARTTVQHLLALEPGLTADKFLAQSPAGRFAHAQRFAEALREAGLP